MTETCDDLVVGTNILAPYDNPVAKLSNLAGSVRLIRGGLALATPRPGDLVCEGDVVETGAAASVAIRFGDGTTFYLGSNSRIVVDAFDPAEVSPGPSSLKVVRGEVGFFPGRRVRDGRLSVETPSAVIRGAASALGASGLAALFVLCLVKEAGADGEVFQILDFDDFGLQHLPFGKLEVITKGVNPQVFMVEHPGESLYVRPRGSGFNVEIVANTRAQMLEMQSSYKAAYEIYALSQLDPFFQLFQRAAHAGSGDSLDAAGFKLAKFDPFLGVGLLSDTLAAPSIYRAGDQNPGDVPPKPNPITNEAQVTALPISRFQIGTVPFGPNVIVTFNANDFEKVVSITILNVPDGYVFIDKNGKEYTGQFITIPLDKLADLMDVMLRTPPSGVTQTQLEIYATVLGLGGLRDSVPVPMQLTLDLDQTGQVEWVGLSGAWEILANWSTNVPLSTQDVVIDTPTAVEATVASSTEVFINSLRVGANDTLTISGSFAINAADSKPLSNMGTISIEDGGSFLVGLTGHPGQAVNSGSILVVNGSATFVSTTITNYELTDLGLIQIDAPSSVLELQNTVIDSGNLTNHGLIKVTSGTSNSIHDVSDFINDGELQVTGSGTKLLLSNETVANAGGLISVSSNAPLDPSVLELQNAVIDSGDVTNHGLISVTSGALNSIHDLSDFTNDGELRVTGSGTELQLSDETVKNTDGTIYVGLGATLDLTDVTVSGGSLSGPGEIDVTNVTLDGSAGQAVTIDSGTAVTVQTGTTLTLKGPIEGDGEIAIAGSATVDADGTVAVPINAEALADNALLTLTGSADLEVTLTAGDLNAGNTLVGVDSGVLTVHVTGSGDSSNTITTGSNDISIDDADAGDAILVHATSLGDDKTLTLSGKADFTVDNLTGDVDASGLDGSLEITTVDNTDNAVSITTGSSTTTIHGAGPGMGGTTDTINVDATALADGALLTLTGAANFDVTGSTFANTIIGGSGNDTINGGGGDDSLTGGGGNDAFVFAASTATCTVTVSDYTAGDQILLSGIDTQQFNDFLAGLQSHQSDTQFLFGNTTVMLGSVTVSQLDFHLSP